MRDITLEEMGDIVKRLFARYVEPLAETIMTGEIPSVALNVYTGGTSDSDWLAKVKFRNSTAVSIFHCNVYLEDIMRLCRKCKMYLVTKDVFNVSALYYMIHPVFQIDWVEGKDIGDYESMMSSAGRSTCLYIRKYYPLREDEINILNILKYWMMVYTNRVYGKAENVKKHFDNAVKIYTKQMLATKHEQFVTARRFKAQITSVDDDGFIVLEWNVRRNINARREESARGTGIKAGKETGE